MPDNELWLRWKAIDARARDAEARLRDAWSLHDRYGILPSEELMDEVGELRDASNRALSSLVASLSPARRSSDEKDTDAEPA